jgi:hypothetical protein
LKNTDPPDMKGTKPSQELAGKVPGQAAGYAASGTSSTPGLARKESKI